MEYVLRRLKLYLFRDKMLEYFAHREPGCVTILDPKTTDAAAQRERKTDKAPKTER